MILHGDVSVQADEDDHVETTFLFENTILGIIISIHHHNGTIHL